jgi:two-component system, chemotaxis family, CheB/CheR fusion protein
MNEVQRSTNGDGEGPDHLAAPRLVVGLGASAGGIKALQQFFLNMPPDSGAAFVVVLHLSPEHESHLAEVLQVATRMPVLRATATVRLQPDHVYVISPHTSLRMTDGHLTVSDPLRLEERRAPVDIFFRTLADSHGPRAVSIVLSGTGPDGSSGLKRVNEHGGITMAQEPRESEHDDMPRNAIATGLVQFVLPVAEMPAKLLVMARQADSSPRDDPQPSADTSLDTLPEILQLIRLRTGHDFSQYKTATVLRRIARRQQLHELPRIEAYSRFLRDHPDEVQALQRELLISVTHFFRDPGAFAALEHTIVPRLFHNKYSQHQVRVWVAGCATGEEAYSIAMLLAEAAGACADPPALQVFATDLDASTIAEAREACYTDADVADVSPERLRRFFVRETSEYRVRRDLRETVLFAHHNLLRDPPFSHLDLVCCRNLLIYLNRDAQARAIQTLQYALRPGGYLFLGSSESPEGMSDLFATIDKDAHIYEARTVAARPFSTAPEPFTPTPRQAPQQPVALAPRISDRLSNAELHLRLLEQYAPPSIVVTEEHQVVHVSERAAQYLQVTGGELSRDLMRLVRPELRVELRTALYRAHRDRVNVEVGSVDVAIDGQPHRVTLGVRPILGREEPARGFFLVLFSEVDAPAAVDSAAPPTVQLSSPLTTDTARQLEEELLRLKGQLRATVEQYETHVEEAKASNEELQATNEELRSAAEELETSKEELQSVNEELTTVNQELKIKIEELAVTNNNFQNLINSTEIGTIFLDRLLRVKLSTPRVRDIFNILPLDAGRPLSDITSNLVDDRLNDDAEEVLQHLQTIEREVQTRQGRWYLTRVLPYRTTQDRIEGVVMTFLDVTERRQAESLVRASEERLRLLIDSVKDYAIFTIAPDGLVASWNTGAQRVFGYTEAEIVGQPFDTLFTPEDRERGVPQQERELARTEGRAEDERWHVRKDGTLLFCSGVTTPLGDAQRRGYAKVARDLTASRENDVALKRARAELEERVRQMRDLELQVEERTGGERRVSSLVRRLVTAQEDERARIARDMHDVVGQQLTALRLSLERHESRCTATIGDDGDLARARGIVQEIDDQLDFLAWELRPAALDDLGLGIALSRYVQSWSAHHGVRAEFRAVGIDSERLGPATETSFYRIAQEALNNVAKHATASRVDVIAERRGGEAVLVIEDDGVGFEPSETDQGGTGMGLIGMRERAALIGATLLIESSPGEGTTVFVRQASSDPAGNPDV